MGVNKEIFSEMRERECERMQRLDVYSDYTGKKGIQEDKAPNDSLNQRVEDMLNYSRNASKFEEVMSQLHEKELKEGYKESDGKLNYELDWAFIEQMAERMQVNKGKYTPYNWQKPMDVEKLKQSMVRHFVEVMKGNYVDEGRAFGHLEALALNSMFICYQLRNYASATSKEHRKWLLGEIVREDEKLGLYDITDDCGNIK